MVVYSLKVRAFQLAFNVLNTYYNIGAVAPALHSVEQMSNDHNFTLNMQPQIALFYSFS